MRALFIVPVQYITAAQPFMGNLPHEISMTFIQIELLRSLCPHNHLIHAYLEPKQQ
jgi:hypothetical protein